MGSYIILRARKRSNSTGRLQLGDATIRPTLYLATLYIAMTTKMLRMVVLLVYARLLALHTTSPRSTCYTPSDVPSATPHTSTAHACTHVCNAMCQMQTPTNTHTLCEKSPFICYHTEKTSKSSYNTDLVANLASPQEKEIPCQMESNVSIYFNLTALGQWFWKKREI